MPGMGHIYCGRIVKGITALFLMYALIPAILISLFGVYFSLGWLIVDIFVGLLLGLFLIVDSGYIAKCKTEGYVLKDYNKWYVYLILYIFVISSTIYGDLWIRERYFEKFIISTASNYPTMIPGD